MVSVDRRGVRVSLDRRGPRQDSPVLASERSLVRGLWAIKLIDLGYTLTRISCLIGVSRRQLDRDVTLAKGSIARLDRDTIEALLPMD